VGLSEFMELHRRKGIKSSERCADQGGGQKNDAVIAMMQ
jgi:hypothetical protein